MENMYLGTCCDKPLAMEKKDVDVGPAVIKNMPVGVCQVCGEHYYDLFFMADLDNLPVGLLSKVLS